MATIPIRRKRALGVPVWVYPVLVLIVALTAWVVVATAGEETAATDGDSLSVAVAAPEPAATAAVPPPPPPTAAPVTQVAPAATAADPAAQSVTQAAVQAGAAAGAAAGRAAIASVVDLGRTIRESSATAGALNGRPVQIVGARVSSVVSDRAFYVGTGSDRVLVLMDPSAQGGASGVRVGDPVTLNGQLETYAPGMSESGVAPDAGQSGYVVVTRPGGVVR